MEIAFSAPRAQGKARRVVRSGGAKRICGSIPPQHDINQQTLEQLATTYTKPISLGGKFTPSAAVVTLRDMAKAGGGAAAWEAYRAAIRKEKEEWKGLRITQACSDWAVYKSITKSRKQWGEQYMAAVTTEDPVRDIQDHFRAVFHSDKQEEDMTKLEGLLQEIDCTGRWEPFSEQEVRGAIMRGKRGKAVGPDRVPTELLQCLCHNPTSLTAVTNFLNGIAESGQIPEHWDKSIATLLPKVVPPNNPKDLRPIALASHTSKAFARLLLGRLQEVLEVKGYKQFATKGRQRAEFLWSALNIVHLAKEWKQDAYILKLDIRKAFDTVNRYRLARQVVEWAAGSKSFEVRCLIRLLMSREMMITLPWCDYTIDENVGVKQGATESPILFAKLLDDILNGIRHEGHGAALQDMNVDGACFMDDVLTWKASLSSLQDFVDMLVPRLAEYGLEVQPTKCSLLCVQGDRQTPLLIAGKPLLPLAENEVLYVMNLPLRIIATETTIMEHLIDRARRKFFGIVHILTTRAPLSARMKLLNTVVFGVLRWVIGALFPSAQLQSMLNYFQVNCVRRMMKTARKTDELWIDYEARSLRWARAIVHKVGGKRWGDVHAEAYWDFVGHRTRSGVRDNPSTAGILSHFRGIDWWQEQQHLSTGARHRRHFPHLMNCERRVARTVGSTAWRERTVDRPAWQALRSKWVADVAIAWASGRHCQHVSNEVCSVVGADEPGSVVIANPQRSHTFVTLAPGPVRSSLSY